MSSIDQKQIATDFLTLTARGDAKKAFELYAGKHFIHHNGYFKAGAESLMTAMEENSRKMPNKIFEIKQILEDANKVATYSHVIFKPDDPGVVVVHIFRFEQGKIAELWDIGQAIPAEAINEAGMF